MRKSKLIDLIRSLDKREMRDFGKSLTLKAKNKPKLVQLFNLLKKHYPLLTSESLKKDTVYNKLFDKKPFDDRKFRTLLSDLTQLVEEFIMHAELANNSLEREYILLKAFEKRQLDKYFIRNIDRVKAKLKEEQIRDIDYFYHNYKLSNLLYGHPNTQKIELEIDSLKDAMYHLDLFFCAEKLRYSCEMMNREILLTANYNIDFLDEVMDRIKQEPYADNPYLIIYRNLVEAIVNKSNENFYRLRDLIKMHIHIFTPGESQHDVVTFLINFSNHIYHQGNLEFLGESFEIYKFGLERDVFIDRGFMDKVIFNNIVSNACKVGKYDYASDFIDNYQNNLEKSIKDNTVALCRAIVEFNKKNFDKTLEVLRMVEFNDSYDNMLVRGLMLRSYYELDTYALSLDDFMKAFVAYLRRNKIISEQYKTQFYNLIKIIKKLNRAKHEKSITREEIRQELDKTQLVAYRLWLHEKLAEL